MKIEKKVYSLHFSFGTLANWFTFWLQKNLIIVKVFSEWALSQVSSLLVGVLSTASLKYLFCLFSPLHQYKRAFRQVQSLKKGLLRGHEWTRSQLHWKDTFRRRRVQFRTRGRCFHLSCHTVFRAYCSCGMQVRILIFLLLFLSLSLPSRMPQLSVSVL